MKSSSPLSFLAMIARVAWGLVRAQVSRVAAGSDCAHLDRQKLTQGHA